MQVALIIEALLFSPPAKGRQILRAYGELPIMSIENPTLAHFRHFKHFRHSSLSRYPDSRYETRLTQPKRAAQPYNEIQSTNYYVRNYQRNMQNKPNFQKAKMNVSIYYTKLYENETAFRRGKNKPNSNPISKKPT